jgi:hypothetical protein
MFTILQIIISVVVIYLIFAVIVYIIVEWISGLLQLRGKMLRSAVLNLFRDARIGQMIYNHPSVNSLKPPNDRLTSYIPAANIASALIDTIGCPVSANSIGRMKNAFENYIEGVNQLEEGPHKTLLATLGQHAKDVKSLSTSIEKWFNDSMDRVSGWYKRKMRIVILSVSAAVTIAFNVDTVHIILAVKADPVLRQHLNDLGDKLLADSVINRTVLQQGSDLEYYEDYVNDSSINASDSLLFETEDQRVPADTTLNHQHEKLEQFLYMKKLVRDSDLPIGWEIKKDNPLPYTFLGWVITTFALSAGAPFWFDILKKLVNIRAAGPKPMSKD